MIMAKQNILAAAMSLIVTSACRQVSVPKVSYPTTERGSTIDDYFGTKVPAPYRWMEDLDSKEVAGWVAAENRVSFDSLAKLPMREHFRRRITQLWNYPKASIPVREGGRNFYSKNSGLQQQSPIYMCSSLAGPATLVLDPNVLSPDAPFRGPNGHPLAMVACWRTASQKAVRIGGRSTSGILIPARTCPPRFAGCASPTS